ncbi:hypothetical protein Xbed_02617 [Xenorhabdus beddingii]|uniref:Uncharacterized protein n=2 Tax=Xenorhabdus beddingii TaxID=40578 RepID=A0A1Y2SJY1_9GAMM|nr:hypothetical protein Xbed_02617 [Xenorhabdus beddingii]
MLLPHKHIRFANSLIAIAGYIRRFLDEPRSLDELWVLVNEDHDYALIKPSFTQLILAVDILFAIQIAESNPDGHIFISPNQQKKMFNGDLQGEE